ncbi:MAG: glycosyltransferase [Desulfomonilia bacterium]|jgi:trehalose synthase|uniref:Trehalose synthase n=1 Tax=anaerobic digester metagenome TaxID=1263854 RepID=A0A485LZV9_9ZZZZ|nr:glycosyltransferase [Pseudomonadota bacterium]HPD20594.1 glycosyltransferase [Deltaproteobacteria bacterium]HPX17324.1 glycosyltransferase [Deltaproteobacteria bacterium]HRS55484.1 glycosyltransferase [Desulfomonilia bacterium]HRV35103.1 glycosyltransferase [Desulfomonilia bacterium]
MHHRNNLTTIDDYRPLVGPAVVERIREKADMLRGVHVAHINSTYYGGGVAEILSPLTLLMNSVGVKTGWRVIQGAPDFFSITKKMHNALQGDAINLSPRKCRIYEDIIHENAVRNHLHNHDFVVVHDPQPLPMVSNYKKNCPWVWRCHLDLTSPNQEILEYLLQFIEMHDAVILSLEEYRQRLKAPQLFFKPCIDPFSIKNRDMSDEEIRERLDHYHIPTDLPIVTQISRFDRWKDPAGVIEAFKLARKEVPCTLVLLGNVATDDPEGAEVYNTLLNLREERIIIISRQDTALVNALQRHAAVVIQKSLREGFGLTVTEAMWKGAAVIGGNVGGISYQIEDGVNGFLVSTIEEAADRIVRLIRDKDLRSSLGRAAHEQVRENFLMTRLLEDYLDLFSSFETIFRLKGREET